MVIAFGVLVDIFLALGFVEDALEFAFLDRRRCTLMGSLRIL